jgi:hypothetical protein
MATTRSSLLYFEIGSQNLYQVEVGMEIHETMVHSYDIYAYKKWGKMLVLGHFYWGSTAKNEALKLT